MLVMLVRDRLVLILMKPQMPCTFEAYVFFHAAGIIYIYIPSASYLDYRGLPIFQACEQQTKGMHFKGLTLSNATSVRVHSQSTQQGQAQEGLC